MQQRRNAVAGVACLLGVVLLGLIVGPGATAFDAAARRDLEQPLRHRHNLRRIAAALETEEGAAHGAWATAVIPVAAAALLVLIAAVRRHPAFRLGRWRWLVVMWGVALALELLLRVAFARTGPHSLLFHRPPDDSYPSGAALLVALGWITGVVVVGSLYPRLRYGLILIAGAALLLHGWVRIAFGAHWATDIIGAYLLAAGAAFIGRMAAAALWPPVRPAMATPSAPRRRG